jgi:hypothetical protein
MKLQELGAKRLHDQAERLIENQFGKQIDFGAVGPKRARGILEKVQGLLREHRRRPDFHRSEQNPAYLQLVILEQALAARISEVDAPVAIDTNDPKTKQIMQKAERGQNLSPDEQKTMNAIALMKKEGKKAKPMVREQSELQQAQVVLAAQDMIDRVQGMLEDISEMQFKDLPALADSIKNDMGTDQATQFQSSASAALSNLLQAMQSGKSELESAQGILTGQAPAVPGAAAPGLDQAPVGDAGGEEELDLSLDANLDTEPEEEPEADLGRERR